MTNPTIYALVRDRLGLTILTPMSPRAERIICHYQEWLDRRGGGSANTDAALARCLHDLAGANDFPGHDQRTEPQL